MGVLGILSKLRGKGGAQASEFDKAVVHALVSADTQRSETEHEEARLLAINKPLLMDDWLLGTLERLAVIEWTDDKGQPRVHVDWDALAMRTKDSPVLRGSYVDPIDAQIRMVKSRRFAGRIELMTSEDEYELGATNFYEAMDDHYATTWADATNGRKAKLLKVSPRQFEISMPEHKQEKGQQ